MEEISLSQESGEAARLTEQEKEIAEVLLRLHYVLGTYHLVLGYQGYVAPTLFPEEYQKFVVLGPVVRSGDDFKHIVNIQDILWQAEQAGVKIRREYLELFWERLPMSTRAAKLLERKS